MSAVLTAERSSDARLWLMALLASLGINGAVILLLAVLVVRSLIFAPPVDPGASSAPKERVMTIQPVTRAEEPAAVEEERLGFARTSDDQPTGVSEDPDFIGERDTLGTSERAPDAGAPDLPSQSGIEPRVEGEMETTESEYQDGRLDTVDPAGVPGEPVAANPVDPVETSEAAEATETVESRDSMSPPPVEAPEEGEPGGRPDRLAESPFPVDLPVPPDVAEEEPKSVPENERPAEEAQEMVEESPEREEPATPRTAAGSEPGFRGFQRRTELKGSISRQGRSALDVKAGPLGAYHAALSRAIEREWQRQVIRNRDFITPGVLRIRVVLDEDGQVRSVGTVEEVGVGAIQKGFTHMAIREADLPQMPAEVKRELDGEPLELLYNFIF